MDNIALTALEKIVAKGKARVSNGIAALQNEYQMRKDFMVQPQGVTIDVDEKGLHTSIPNSGGYLDLTPHSRTQLLSRSGVPQAYADKLIEYKQYDLLKTNMHTLMPVVSKDGMMFRVVGNTAKGIMSSSYRRIDASPMVETFVENCLRNGLIPHDGMVTDTRAFLSFLNPNIIEIFPGEYVVFGMEFRSSDYGRGAAEVDMSLLRLLCQNGMVGFDLLRKIHVGRRFDASEYDESGPLIDISARTIELDVTTVRSAITDVMKSADRYSKAITSWVQASEHDEVSMPELMASLKKKGIKKAIVDQVKTMYESPLPVELVPETPGMWRFANVISMLANSAEGDDKKDLQDVAFSYLVPKKALAA
jgi:hypothetical protein